MADAAADEGWLTTVLRIILIVQMVVQGLWITDSPLLCLPGIHKVHLSLFRTTDGSRRCVDSLPELSEIVRRDEMYLHKMLNGNISPKNIDQVT